MEKKVQKIYLTYCIDSARFIASSLSNLANNLFERIRRIKCEFGHNDKTCKKCGIKYKYYNFFLEYINFADDLIE